MKRKETRLPPNRGGLFWLSDRLVIRIENVRQVVDGVMRLEDYRQVILTPFEARNLKRVLDG